MEGCKYLINYQQRCGEKIHKHGLCKNCLVRARERVSNEIQNLRLELVKAQAELDDLA